MKFISNLHSDHTSSNSEDTGATRDGTYPRPRPRAYPHPTSSPRGSHPEVCRWRGGGSACGWGYDPLPGGFGAPPKAAACGGVFQLKVMQTAQACLHGVLRPLCEELAGRHGGTASAGPKTRQGRHRTEKRLSPFRDHPLHETKEIAQASLPNWRRGPQLSETPCRISAARRLKNAGNAAKCSQAA